MKRKDAFPSNYLGQSDLTGPRIVTIDYVEMQEIQGEGGKENKPVMHFSDFDKPLILNNINWQTCEDVYGDDSDMWHGKKVEAYVDPSVMFGAKRVGGVRLRLPVNGRTMPAASPAGANAQGWWTFEQAVQECANAGIGKPELVNMLKGLGLKGYSPERDTDAVKSLIEGHLATMAQFNSIPSANEEVPLG